jgi:ABC-type dipeptide/oligopeptide/nickel transport system permease component
MSCLLSFLIAFAILVVIHFILESFFDDLSRYVSPCIFFSISIFLVCFVYLIFSDCSYDWCTYHDNHSDGCQCIVCEPHADDCQCNECVINRCDAINHGDTCRCDKCIACKDKGGN